jgi:hypothetical protein
MKKLAIILMLLNCLYLINPDESTNSGINYAKEYLENSLKGKSFNLVGKQDIITDKEAAIDYAELILFKIYGEKKIVEQKPYEIFLINNYWVISGILPKGYTGGAFKIIIDKRNGAIINIGHDK